MIIFLTNLLPTTTGVLFGPLLRVILGSIYLLSLRRDEKFKNIEDFIGLEWWNDNVINPIVLVKQQDHVADAFFEYIHHQYYQ